MTRRRVSAALLGGGLVALAVWLASHSYWEEIRVPMPPRGEALVNPFYAAQRFAERLGAHTQWDRVFTPPPTASVIVLSAWHWTLGASRQQALERWVESGGRLVVDDSLTGGEDAFERWSGIRREKHRKTIVRDGVEWSLDNGECHQFLVEAVDPAATDEPGVRHQICGVRSSSTLTIGQPVEWAVRGSFGIAAIRVRVGQGHVTFINATPFRHRSLFDGDHGWLFVAATQLRRDDDVRFLSEESYPSLLALIWRYGAPVVLLSAVATMFVLWRGAVRFAPVVAPPEPARRSLAEQIRGTGRFALRYGGGESLHAAVLRALHEAAERRVPGYSGLSGTDRIAALARLTRIDGSALAAAIDQRRPDAKPAAMALLETARRQILFNQKK